MASENGCVETSVLIFEDYLTTLTEADFRRAWADGYRGTPLQGDAPLAAQYPYDLGVRRAAEDSARERSRLSERLDSIRLEAEDERNAAAIRGLAYPVVVAKIEDRWGYIWAHASDECDDYDDVLQCFEGEDGGMFRLVGSDGGLLFVEGKPAGPSKAWRWAVRE